jgi:hypothetical protein
MKCIDKMLIGYLREKGYHVCTEEEFVSAFGTLNNEVVKGRRTLLDKECTIKALEVTVARQEQQYCSACEDLTRQDMLD